MLEMVPDTTCTVSGANGTAGPIRTRYSTANHAEQVTERLIDYLMNLNNIRGAGRIWLP
jgi:hypothetical protein